MPRLLLLLCALAPFAPAADYTALDRYIAAPDPSFRFALNRTLTFPGLTPGTSSTMSITLYNDGTAAVNIKTISISPADGTFTQTNSCPATLIPNTNCIIQVTFTPPDSGKYNATLSVTDSDKSSPQTASLSGIGLNN